MKRRLFALVPLIAVIVTVLSSFVTVLPLSSTAYAAIPSDANLLAQGKANAECRKNIWSNDQIESCAFYYVSGYKDGYNNGGKGSIKDICSGDKAGLFISECQKGYKQGQDAGKRQKAAEANPKPPTSSGSLTVAQITALASTSTECGPSKGQLGYSDCVAGYVGGYQGKNKDSICNSTDTPGVNICKRGFDAGKKDKAAKVTNQAQQAAVSGDASDSDSDTANQQLDCDMSGSPLSWILCPIIDTLALAINGLDRLITNYMKVDTSEIFDSSSDTSAAYHAAWQSFRNIALGLMIIVGLVIVISQALGMEILDAYTIRKTLPRLLIAAIGISLSWPLMHFLIDASNWLGFGIRRLIYFPFTQNGLDATIDLDFGGGIGNMLIGGGALAVGAVGAGIWALLGGLAVIGSLAATGALAVLIAVLVLVLRQIAIILLMLLAPLAIIAFALPNTHKFYKFWWESFSKALLMFPLIAAFIATGHVFAAISFSDKGNPFSQLIGFIAYIAPYFLIPLTFRFAGGFVSQLGGFVNNRGQGGFGWLKKQRQGAYQKNTKDLFAGNRLKGKRWIPGSIKASNAINEAGKGVGTGWNGRYGLGPRGREARAAVNQMAAIEAQKTEGLQSVAGWNDVNRVLAMGMGDERKGSKALYEHLMAGGDDGVFGEGMTPEQKQAAARAKVDKALVAAKVAGGFTKANAIAGFKNMARDGTAIRDVKDLARIAATVGDGDMNNTYTFAAEAASVSRQVGRPDLAAASEPIGDLSFAYHDQLFPNKEKLYTGKQAVTDLEFEAWKSGAGGEIAYTKMGNAKSRTIRNDTREAVNILKKHRAAVEAGQKSPYSAEAVQFAAITLYETQESIKQGLGKMNNRTEAIKELNKDDGALDFYLDSKVKVDETVQTGTKSDGTPTYTTAPITITNRDAVKKIAGDRYAGMSEAERLAAMKRDADGDT